MAAEYFRANVVTMRELKARYDDACEKLLAQAEMLARAEKTLDSIVVSHPHGGLGKIAVYERVKKALKFIREARGK